ncbi:MAG TPA: hypothetical protein VIJ39_14450 [Solirubrobacteraceae bacterium]
MADNRVLARGGMPVNGGARATGCLGGFADGGVGCDGRQHACEGGAHCHDPTVGATQALHRGIASSA